MTRERDVRSPIIESPPLLHSTRFFVSMHISKRIEAMKMDIRMVGKVPPVRYSVRWFVSSLLGLITR